MRPICGISGLTRIIDRLCVHVASSGLPSRPMLPALQARLVAHQREEAEDSHLGWRLAHCSAKIWSCGAMAREGIGALSKAAALPR